jgi:hypothetical protein
MLTVMSDLKFFDTPALIGNWLFLALSTYGIVQYFTKNRFGSLTSSINV